MTIAIRSDTPSKGVSKSVIDLQQLLDRCMGSLELAERCVVRFEQKLRADLEEVHRAADAEDFPALVQIAHRVKGSSATVAAGGLANVSAALEDAARREASAELAGLVVDFLREVNRFLEAVPRFSQRCASTTE